MKNFKLMPIYVIFFAFLGMTLIVGCGGPKTALDNASKGNPQVPTDLDLSKGVLLVEIVNNEKRMEKHLKESFPYKYELTDKNAIYGSNDTYTDKNYYRYALVSSVIPAHEGHRTSSSGMPETYTIQPIFKYYLYDRLNNKTYAALGHGSSLFMWAFRAATKRLLKK